jgi:hypothetical protein
LLLPFTNHIGLPIGNLTSQFFANLYLNKFDHFIKEKMCCKYYIRYVDDFVVFGNDKKELHEIKQKISNYLNVNLKLNIHPVKTQIFPVIQGTDFLGFRIFPTHRLLRKSNFFYFQRRFKKLRELYYKRKIDLKKIIQSINSWFAHLSWGDTWRLRDKLFNEIWL